MRRNLNKKLLIGFIVVSLISLCTCHEDMEESMEPVPSESNVGRIVGAVAGVSVVLILVLGAVFFSIYKKNKKPEETLHDPEVMQE